MQVDKRVLSNLEVCLTLLRSKFDYTFHTEYIGPSWVQNLFLVNINDVEKNFQ